MTPLPDEFDVVAELALLADNDSIETSLRRLADTAVRVVAGCDHASVTMVDGGRASTSAATSWLAVALDDAQYTVDDGPCLAAHRTGENVALPAIDASPGPFEAFRAAAAEAGVTASLSVPIAKRNVVGGSLNCYSTGTTVFAESAVHLAGLLAVQGAIMVANAVLLESTRSAISNLSRALESRDIIGQAKGILMASHRITAEAAFDLLRQKSQRDNVKLNEVAADVARTGELES